MVNPADEFAHSPGAEPNWQENYMLVGWDAATDAGIYLHLAHVPALDVMHVITVVSDRGRTISASTTHPGGDCLAAPDLDINVKDPLVGWDLRYSGLGAEGVDQHGLLAQHTGDTPFGFDISIHSGVPAVDWAPVADEVGLPPHIITQHYEIGCQWSGTVRLGDSERSVSGLLVRDHSWGPRNLDFSTGFWTPMVLDEGDLFVSAASMQIADRWIGFVIATSADGSVTTWSDHWARPHGPLRAHGFGAATVLGVDRGGRADRFEFQGHAHLPVRYLTMADRPREMSDMPSAVTWNGKSGFGTFQHING